MNQNAKAIFQSLYDDKKMDPAAKENARKVFLQGQKAGYEKGFTEGYCEGHREGHVEGHEEGHDEGHAKGHTVGHAEGYAAGRLDGQQEGRSIGLTEGRTQGRAEGHAEGFSAGCAQGRAEGRTEGHAEGHAEGHQIGFEEGYRKGLEEARRQAEAAIANLEAMIHQDRLQIKQLQDMLQLQESQLLESIEQNQALTQHLESVQHTRRILRKEEVEQLLLDDDETDMYQPVPQSLDRGKKQQLQKKSRMLSGGADASGGSGKLSKMEMKIRRAQELLRQREEEAEQERQLEAEISFTREKRQEAQLEEIQRAHNIKRMQEREEIIQEINMRKDQLIRHAQLRLQQEQAEKAARTPEALEQKRQQLAKEQQLLGTEHAPKVPRTVVVDDFEPPKFDGSID